MLICWYADMPAWYCAHLFRCDNAHMLTMLILIVKRIQRIYAVTLDLGGIRVTN